MPRKYKKKLGARHYINYTKETLITALRAIKQRRMTVREASKEYKIPVRTLYVKIKRSHSGKPGGQQVLTEVEERHFVDVVIACGEFGAPLTIFDLKMIIKTYLNKQGRIIKKFKNGDTPGKDWCYNFLDRHKEKLTQRVCQNIKQSRAMKSEDEMEKYFRNLRESLADVPPENILNFDETNFTDDPGAKKCIFRRGMKYPERVMSTSKSAVSLMFAASASGKVLPPYVVYKGERLYDQWCIGGPKNTKYNRTKSGWFDAVCFQDWFERIAIPWARPLSGRKILIGDNLSSHVQIEVLRQCQQNNIRFVFLPANSTHLTQPLDVGFFRSLKNNWKQIITKYKTKNPKNCTVNKSSFPELLKQLMDKIKINEENIVKNAFKATGIVPLNPDAVMKRLPSRRLEENVTEKIDNSLLEYLKETRAPKTQVAPRKPKKMLRIDPGKSVSYEDLYSDSTSESDESEEADEMETEADEVDDGANKENETVDIEDEADGLKGKAEGADEIEKTVVFPEKDTCNVETEQIGIGSFVVVQFPTKKTIKHFIGTVIDTIDNEFQIKFLRQCLKNGFAFPQTDDISLIMEKDIVKVLSNPEIRRGIHKFICDLSIYNL